jgi:hypothetical protein
MTVMANAAERSMGIGLLQLSLFVVIPVVAFIAAAFIWYLIDQKIESIRYNRYDRRKIQRETAEKVERIKQDGEAALQRLSDAYDATLIQIDQNSRPGIT